MAPRTIYLISTRSSKTQRAHFAIWVPSAQQPTSGSLINVVGAPMIGFAHEFKRCYEPAGSTEPYEIWPIGEVDSAHIFDWPEGGCNIRTDPKGDLEIAAAQVPAPGVSRDTMAPVDHVCSFYLLWCLVLLGCLLLTFEMMQTTNRRCQEWTMDYVRYLVAKGYIGAEAIEIVQSKRDSPTHGLVCDEWLRSWGMDVEERSDDVGIRSLAS
ncbi:unnamed protein product [Aspergillus oryzae]|uniref:DNA, SC011 n=2 Tax=Aspergillus oryzae TaxID=5062 RepID=Q2TZW1_ASPOR|nr:unnamed protein product [Aspergillus oryzae RIB40]BAE65154.1 unnamed protein product [Aspergillus oryzae RIB40]GMF87243.1 unnamed protein product [Aspergillus oryzae]GMG03954.1 unnamed protein product [Aspergillus oryzae]GMG46819.1 unnamed protein product [Aspergillus oryzae var. brunneus]